MNVARVNSMQALAPLLRTSRNPMWAIDFEALKSSLGNYKTNAQGGIDRILVYAARYALSQEQLAYVLATVYHETAGWMQPLREGATRYGPVYTDAQARAAVAAIYAKGIITTNYALPHPKTGLSYYGRGLVQITWYDNYAKFGIADHPDKALEWETALDITFRGMVDGMFRKGYALSMIKSSADWYNARDIINGDKRKNGTKVANLAAAFYAALKQG